LTVLFIVALLLHPGPIDDRAPGANVPRSIDPSRKVRSTRTGGPPELVVALPSMVQSKPDRNVRLLEAGLILASELSLEAVLQRIVELAVEVTGARYGALGILGPDGDIIEFITTGVTEEQRRAIGHPPIGRGILGNLIRDARPMRINDIAQDPRSVGFPPNHPPMRSFLGAPVKSRGNVFGNIYLTEKQGADRFDEDDEAALVVLAAQAGVAVENAHLYQEARDNAQHLAVIDERERIAKELHDGAIQSLFAVGMGLQAAATLSGSSDLEQRIEGAVSEIDRVIRDLRNYIFGLRPGILADRQLDQALRHLAEDLESKSGVTTVVKIEGEVAAELAFRAADVIQLAREALSNVGRHAKAATCRVSLSRRDSLAVLEIDDDGGGFDVDASKRKGQGLRNLADRAAALGGELSIESSPEAGTKVRVAIPL
jgi:signal transduction histidine kinase